MSLEFKPTIKSINIANEDLTKITLEVKNDSLDGKYEDLRRLSGKTVVMAVIPETYQYTQEFDASTKTPIMEWIVNSDGTAEVIRTEQTQLDVDGQGNIDIKKVDKKVNKDIIDEYILKSSSLTLPEDLIINPRDVIYRMNAGIHLEEISDDYEMSDAKLLSEIEKARTHFAPFADYWDKHREDIVFQEQTEDTEKESKSVEEKLAMYPDKSEVNEEEPETEENEGAADDEEDPY